jgi:hypothetical protein
MAKFGSKTSLVVRLETRSARDQSTGCWEWQGVRNRQGYGVVAWPRLTRETLVHRVAYRLFVGDPGALCVLHRCDNPPCLNPEHLFLGTRADNLADMRAKGRARTVISEKARANIPRGERCWASKITEADVRAIRADPRNHTEVARSWGLNVSHVRAIRLRQSWAHVA